MALVIDASVIAALANGEPAGAGEEPCASAPLAHERSAPRAGRPQAS